MSVNVDRSGDNTLSYGHRAARTATERAWLDLLARAERETAAEREAQRDNAELEADRNTITSILARYRRAQDVLTLPPGYTPLTQAANAPVAPFVTVEDVERAQDLAVAVNTVAPLPPGMAVSHSLNTAAYIGQATAWNGPPPNLVGVSWDRAPPPVYVGNPKNDFGQLISRLLGGVMQNVTLSWRGGSTKRLSFEIEVPNDMSYETMVANLHQLSRELGGKPSATDTGRRRLLKLEEEA